MIVTKVEPLSKTKYKIYLNHQFAFVLYKGELRSYKISDGRELSEEELDEIREKILLKRAKKRAMHLLEDMDRSEVGLREKLKAGLYPEDLIEAAVTYVKSFGYLNDVRYAENFILARKSTKSKREILALLNRKGICSADIEKAFESCYGESEEVEAVRRILAKKKVDVRTADEREMQKIRGNEISMIFQEPMTSLNPIIKCGKQIAESLRLHRGMKKKEAMEEAIRMMRAVGIANPEVRAHEYPHQMSGGMRQRVMIAMALACQPQILIADEPTTALDVTIQAQILDLIREMNEELHSSVLFITHDLGVVSELCDTVIVMYTGHIVEQAPAGELFRDPKHPYTIGLLNAIPVITKDRKPLSAIEGMVPNPTERIKGCSFWPRCPHATERCRTVSPPMKQLSEERKVRCWLFEYQAAGKEA